MFNFPWSNFHELNLDWILKVVKEAKDVWTTGRADIDYAVETAEEAKTIATQAAEAQIADNSVSTPKIQDGAVTTAKLNDGAVTTAKLNDGAVTTAKISNGAVDYWKLTSALQSKVDLVDTLNNRITRKFILIGDSYSVGYTSDEGEIGGWIDDFISTYGLTENTNVFLHDRFRAGLTGTPGFSINLGTRQFSTQLQWIIDNRIPAGTVITDIIVLGGTNDLGQSEADITGGIQQFCSIASQNFPYADIKIGCLLGYNGPSNSSWRTNFTKIVNLYSNVNAYGGHYIVNSEYICGDKTLFGNRDDYSDYYHPDRAGYRKINIFTRQIWNGSSVSVYRRESANPAITPSSEVSGFPARLNVQLKNDVISLETYGTSTSPYIAFTPATSIVMSYHFATFDYDVGLMNTNIFCPNSVDATNSLQTEILGTDLAGVICPGMGFYYFTDDGHLHIAGILFRTTNTNQTVTRILASKFDYTLPSMKYCY